MVAAPPPMDAKVIAGTILFYLDHGQPRIVVWNIHGLHCDSTHGDGVVHLASPSARSHGDDFKFIGSMKSVGRFVVDVETRTAIISITAR
jgi:hypothetical protein